MKKRSDKKARTTLSKLAKQTKDEVAKAYMDAVIHGRGYIMVTPEADFVYVDWRNIFNKEDYKWRSSKSAKK